MYVYIYLYVYTYIYSCIYILIYIYIYAFIYVTHLMLHTNRFVCIYIYCTSHATYEPENGYKSTMTHKSCIRNMMSIPGRARTRYACLVAHDS